MRSCIILSIASTLSSGTALWDMSFCMQDIPIGINLLFFEAQASRNGFKVSRDFASSSLTDEKYQKRRIRASHLCP
jgi:hypothetical protein